MLELLQMLGQTLSAQQDRVALDEISPEGLAEQGYRAIILDVDNTVSYLKKDHPTDEAVRLVGKAKESGLKVVLLSNVVFTARSERVQRIAIHLEVDHVCAFWPRVKPHPEPFLQALDLAGVDAAEAVMIGDQLIADVFGATRLGIDTILVEPIGEWHPVAWIIAALERCCCRTLGRS